MVKRKKLYSGLVLASLLFVTNATLDSVKAEATRPTQEIVNKVNGETASIESGIEFINMDGFVEQFDVPSDKEVELNANHKSVILKIDGETQYLDNVKELKLKNITVSNTSAFYYLKSAEKITVDGVKFKKGADFGALKNVKELIIKNSEFGEKYGYSLAVHNSSKLETFIVANSTLNDDFRVFSNKALASTSVYDSKLAGHSSQYSNKDGYKTDYYDTKFERNGDAKKIYTSGFRTDTTFDINPQADKAVAKTTFNASNPGTIAYTTTNGKEDVIDVPANTSIKYINDSDDAVSIRLSNNKKYILNEVKDLTFNNVEIKSPLEFTNKNLRLETLNIVGSRVSNVQVWNSETLKELKITDTETAKSYNLVKAYNNKIQNTFAIANSDLANVKAVDLPSVNNSNTGFALSDSYVDGYVYTSNLGDVNYELPIHNTTFEKSISSTNTINGDFAKPNVQ